MQAWGVKELAEWVRELHGGDHPAIDLHGLDGAGWLRYTEEELNGLCPRRPDVVRRMQAIHRLLNQSKERVHALANEELRDRLQKEFPSLPAPSSTLRQRRSSRASIWPNFYVTRVVVNPFVALPSTSSSVP
jgi:2-polyprenyl-6-methoxyphenol hydroxylase-like FAD-dependent oxidoreductase